MRSLKAASGDDQQGLALVTVIVESAFGITRNGAGGAVKVVHRMFSPASKVRSGPATTTMFWLSKTVS